MAKKPKKRRAKPKAAKPNLGGRPTKYEDRFVVIAGKMAQLGALDVDIADALEVDVSTFRLWKVVHPELAEVLKVDKAEADDAVERTLYERARGYTYTGEKIFCHEGGVTRVKTREHVPPSDTAMIFWLKNRRPEQWRDRQEHTGGNGGPVQVEVLGGLPGVKDKK